MKNLRNKKGFTLIELIVVIAILGILMLILVPAFKGYLDDANEAVARNHAKTVETTFKASLANVSGEYTMPSTGIDTRVPGPKSPLILDMEEKMGEELKEKYSLEYYISPPFGQGGPQKPVRVFNITILYKNKLYVYDCLSGSPELKAGYPKKY